MHNALHVSRQVVQYIYSMIRLRHVCLYFYFVQSKRVPYIYIFIPQIKIQQIYIFDEYFIHANDVGTYNLLK